MKITILSDSPFFPTGYRNQAVQLANYLSDKGHEVDYLSNGFTGTSIKDCKLLDGTPLKFNIHGQRKAPYCMDLISDHLKEKQSDRFIILLDTFMMFQHGFLNVDTSPAQTYFWFPSDGGGGLPVNCHTVLQKVDKAVAMAKFGQKQVKDYNDIDAEFIPHGIDSNFFKKLPDKERLDLRRKWNLHNKFVVGVVARNQPRKFLDRTLKAIAEIGKRIPNLILMMHLDPNDPAQAFHIPRLASKYNIENKIRYTGVNCMKGFDWKEMNNIYNLFDVFFLSTSGEGFGIPTIEAMSCEVPVVVTDYTTTEELVKENDSGLAANLVGVENKNFFDIMADKYDMKVSNGTITGSWEVERGIIDVKDAADKIVYLYNHPEEMERMGKNGRKAVLNKYDFKTVVGPKWEKILST